MTKDIPLFATSTVGAMLIEILRGFQQGSPIRMTLALHRKTVVHVSVSSEHFEKLSPKLAALASGAESLRVTDHDERVACTRQEDVKSFGGVHEPDIARRVTAGERDEDNVALFALVVV
jgi:hypothetical protein